MRIKEPKCTKVYISKWEAPWGAARAERPQRGVRKGQTLAADLSAPLSAASLGGAGGLPSGNTPLRTRPERPKAGLALCAGGWARWAKCMQRTRSEQGKSKGRANSEQVTSKGIAREEQAAGSPPGGGRVWPSAGRGAGRAADKAGLPASLPADGHGRAGGLKGGLTNFLPRAIAGNQPNSTQGKSKGRAREKHTHQTYISKIMIIANLR